MLAAVYRKNHKSNNRNNLISPQEFLQNIEQLAQQSNGILKTTDRIYTNVMDVALRQTIQNAKKQRYQSTTVQDQAEFMESLISRLSQPSPFAIRITMKAWEVAGNGVRATQMLNQLCTLYEQNPQLFRQPLNQQDFQSALKACARGPKTSETMKHCRHYQ